jgi:4,5-DOPA dioxygenase extradiol
MPALFIGHGSPMNAVEDNEFSRTWAEVGKSLPTPKAILCISAHWETTGTQVTAMKQPKTIHDFYGFPQELYDKRYPAPGSPELARLVQATVRQVHVRLDYDWGLDHGTWSVLCWMFPQADIPVVQLSLDRTREPAFHYELGKELATFRDKGILIVGSGNMVHNLRHVMWHTDFPEVKRTGKYSD